MLRPPSDCPTCQDALLPRELGCSRCGTVVRGDWSGSPFGRLSDDQQAFLILFVRSRGNLSEVERALGVSYPTVRAKLEELIAILADEPAPVTNEQRLPTPDRRDVLERVARGDLDASEALQLLRQISDSEQEL